MTRSLIAVALLVAPSVARGQITSISGTWEHATQASVYDIYGDACIAEAIKQERFKEAPPNWQSTMRLTQ